MLKLRFQMECQKGDIQNGLHPSLIDNIQYSEGPCRRYYWTLEQNHG